MGMMIPKANSLGTNSLAALTWKTKLSFSSRVMADWKLPFTSSLPIKPAAVTPNQQQQVSKHQNHRAQVWSR